MRTNMLASDFAVEIEGLDLADAMDDATLDAIRELWMQHKIAVFRDQCLDDDALVAFTRRLGPLFVHVRAQFLSPDRSEVMLVSNLKEQGRALGALGDGDLEWHTDQSYTVRPVFGTILYAIEVPDEGGDTYFADLAAAYERMPERLRRRVDGVRAVYSVEKATTSKRAPLTREQRERTPDVSHPLVRSHPYLGRKALYLSPTHIVAIGDLPRQEANALLGELTEWVSRSEFVYRHKWRVGDVVMWDNTSVMHRRDGFSPEKRRYLKRTGFYLPEELGVPFCA